MYNQQRIISIPFPLPGLPGGGGPPGGGWQPGPPPGGGGPPGGWQPGPPPGGGGPPGGWQPGPSPGGSGQLRVDHRLLLFLHKHKPRHLRLILVPSRFASFASPIYGYGMVKTSGTIRSLSAGDRLQGSDGRGVRGCSSA